MKPNQPSPSKPPRRGGGQADTASVRAKMPQDTSQVITRLADETGLTRAQMTALLIGPQPEEKLRQIRDALGALLDQRRTELSFSGKGGG